MKLLIFVLALSCAIAYASAQETSSKELVQYQLPDPIIPHVSNCLLNILQNKSIY